MINITTFSPGCPGDPGNPETPFLPWMNRCVTRELFSGHNSVQQQDNGIVLAAIVLFDLPTETPGLPCSPLYPSDPRGPWREKKKRL